MPFAEEFSAVYSGFIKTTLEEAGYEVSRADELISHQNILKDIVRGIGVADLIVADLTSANPNVYYELGLAHALGKKVILLTQEVSEIPFDLQAYRVVEYSTHFAEIDAARKSLREIAEGALSDSAAFGNPISDFLGLSRVSGTDSRAPATETPSDEATGLLDDVVAVEDGFESLSGLVEEINRETEVIGAHTTRTVENLNRLGSGKGGQAREARAMVLALGQKLGDFSSFLEVRNDRYREIASEMRNALESVLASQEPGSDEERKQLGFFLEAMDSSRSQAELAMQGLTELVGVIRATPRLERTYSRAADRTASQLDRYVENLEQTVSMLTRAIEVGKSKLS